MKGANASWGERRERERHCKCVGLADQPVHRRVQPGTRKRGNIERKENDIEMRKDGETGQNRIQQGEIWTSQANW